ncbi:hypothetical protein [Micromonospora carbonacea]|uniref:Uncharacterized protein n=1 Tax=Micromonospora carbonacea TaxID=47853 RepID=A0A1C4WB34_9ACTN|nr:hypothetical protein [Micromonospora carbonacea]SCE93390.1 hypothetical protein GA0070563_103250 [Micromonospora carbonacea]
MAGRPLKKIPEDRPAKLLAEKLRALRGKISYNQMGRKANFKANTFSQTADGTFRGWPSVEQFLAAVRACGGQVTEDDIAECRRLHELAGRLNNEQRRSKDQPLRPPAPALTDTVVLAPLDDARHAGDGQSVLTFSHTAQAQACPASLANAKTVQDVATALYDLALEKRLNVDDWRTPRTALASDRKRTGSPEWEVLTGRREPTLSLVRQIVEKCGGGPADLTRWEQVWRRVTGGRDRAVGIAIPPERARGSEVRTALDSVDPEDEDLQRIQEGLRRLQFGNQTVPRAVGWPRRLLRRLAQPLARRQPAPLDDSRAAERDATPAGLTEASHEE